MFVNLLSIFLFARIRRCEKWCTY